MKKPLNSSVSVEKTEHHIHVSFDEEYRMLSSAILNGGYTSAKHIVNKHVPKQGTYSESPQDSLNSYANQQAWLGNTIGMMTAASMNSLRIASETVQDIDISVLVTSGLSNARRVGDHAEYREMLSLPEESTNQEGLNQIGTINIIVITSAVLTDAAMAEAFMMVTEAKVAAMYDAGITSPVSNQTATGTGTDTVVIACCKGQENVQYCGKHVLFGEVLGRLAYEAVTSSIQWDVDIYKN